MRRSYPGRRPRSTAATPPDAITVSSRCSVFPTEWLYVANVRSQLMRFGVLIVDAEADDAPRGDTDDRGVQIIARRTSRRRDLHLFGGAADLEAAHPPRVARCDVVDDERDLGIVGDVAELLALR